MGGREGLDKSSVAMLSFRLKQQSCFYEHTTKTGPRGRSLCFSARHWETAGSRT